MLAIEQVILFNNTWWITSLETSYNSDCIKY